MNLDLVSFPGFALINKGLADLACQKVSEESLLCWEARFQLERLGLMRIDTLKGPSSAKE